MGIRLTIFLAVVCWIGSGSLSAQIYRSVDESGNIVFTDTPAVDSKPVELAPASTYSPPPRLPSNPTRTPDSETTAATFYTSLQIVQPAAEETIRDNTGNVAVSLEIEPALLIQAGHRVQFYLDGQASGSPSSALTTSFSNVDRGEHQVEAAVIDVSGKPLLRTNAVRFFLHRYSIINAPNKPAAPPAP